MKTADENKTKKLKILIAEDDHNSYLLLTAFLDDICTEILHAITGVEAVELCRINPDIDLILMDVKMPEMNGYEATRQIRQFNDKVIIIAQSAYALTREINRALQDGQCNAYLTKPIIKEELMDLIDLYFFDN